MNRPLRYLSVLFLALSWACQSGHRAEKEATIPATDTTATTANATAAAPETGNAADEATTPHSGTFVYAEKEPDESHRLVIPGEDSREVPAYYGSESGSGEGIFFYAAGITDLELDAAGNLSFTVGERDLYAEPVKDIYHKPASTAGFSREELRYSGRFVPGGIRLVCQSATQSCWADTLFFKRQ